MQTKPLLYSSKFKGLFRPRRMYPGHLKGLKLLRLTFKGKFATLRTTAGPFDAVRVVNMSTRWETPQTSDCPVLCRDNVVDNSVIADFALLI